MLQQAVPLEYLESVDSTNDYLLRKAASGTHSPLACIANTQTHGKGRNGRRWFAPPGSNLYLSLLWHFHKEPHALSALGLAIALCIVQTLEQIGIQKSLLGIKWPNDIYSLGKKLGGILVESLPYHHPKTSTVIGIGLNLYPFEASFEAISQPWTTVQALSHSPIDRTQLTSLLLRNLVSTLLSFEKQGFKAFYKRWPLYDLSFHKDLLVTTPTGSIQGIGRGIDAEGLLIVESPTGVLTHYTSGEISLRLQERKKGAEAPSA